MPPQSNRELPACVLRPVIANLFSIISALTAPIEEELLDFLRVIPLLVAFFLLYFFFFLLPGNGNYCSGKSKQGKPVPLTHTFYCGSSLRST